MAGMNIPKTVFEVLVKHLVDIEEEKEQLLERYYPDITEERDMFRDFIDNYIKQIENYISNAKTTKSAKRSCPFVIIGSIVEIEDLKYNEVERYQIVSPFESNLESGIDAASYLSPVGRALLLKKVKDKVTVETPAGQFTYLIRAIEIPEHYFAIIDEGDKEAEN